MEQLETLYKQFNLKKPVDFHSPSLSVSDIVADDDLMAELGDIRRFPHRSSIVAFAGVDPGVVGSGKMQLSSVATSKRGSPQLRKALFQVVSAYVKRKPENEAVYQFYAKKRDEGKPYYVCTTAAANKFLRIYYARVKECLNAAESATQAEEG